MWYLLAVMFTAEGPVTTHVEQVSYRTQTECIERALDFDFDTLVMEDYHVVVLDNGVEDSFGLACITETGEA